MIKYHLINMVSYAILSMLMMWTGWSWEVNLGCALHVVPAFCGLFALGLAGMAGRHLGDLITWVDSMGMKG